jgi:hypothetical protein
MSTLDKFRALVARELSLVEPPARREALGALVMEPRLEERTWEYAEPSEPERYPCWVVAEAPARGILVVYCEHGFGPERPWGILRRANDSLGMDSECCSRFEDAAIGAGLLDEPRLALPSGINYPPMTPLDETFLARWSVWYPGAPPIGFLLRAAYPERWLRIHSLPGSKRYATSAADYAELLLRHNTVAADLLGGVGAPCAVLVCATSEGPWSRNLGAQAALAEGDLPFACRLPAALWEQRAAFAEPVHLIGGACTWQVGAFDGFLRAVADDEVKGLVIELERGQVYAPYDGGADLFFATREERDSGRKRYESWVSSRPDGL